MMPGAFSCTLGARSPRAYAAGMTLRAAIGLFLAALLALGAVSPLVAQEGDPPTDLREFTCPLGGTQFTHNVAYSAFPLITLPDGSWLGDTQIGVQIPVCPDNGLVLLPDLAASAAEGSQRILYYDYTPEEVAALPALIAEPEYRALAELGPYAQAAWIAGKIDRPAADRLFMLQRATWATADPALRKRLVELYLAEAPGLIGRLESGHAARAYQQMFVVNALRELGRFDEAGALLEAVVASVAQVPGLPDPDSMFDPASPVAGLVLAIEQRDDGRFAAETLPSRLVADVCSGRLAMMYGPPTPATLASCKIRREREQAEADAIEQSHALRDDMVALAARCDVTQGSEREAALRLACESLQDDRDRISGNRMAQDGPALAAACEATPTEHRSGALEQGCNNYQQALSRALGDILPDDPQALRIVCPGGEDDEGSGVPIHHSSACFGAFSTLKERRKEAMLADPAIALRCFHAREEETSPDYALLLDACSRLEDDRRQAAIARLASDSATFEAACGRFARTNKSGNDIYGLTEAQEQCRRAWRLRENTRARQAAEATGLKCFTDAIYSPERPRCVSLAEYEREMAPIASGAPNPYDLSFLDDGSSLMVEAQRRAAALIGKAKTEGKFRWPD